MAQSASGNSRSERVDLRLSPSEKALLARAAALAHLDMSSFLLRSALPEALSIVEAAKTVQLSERDSLRILDLLEHPPVPSQRLVSAARHKLDRG